MEKQSNNFSKPTEKQREVALKMLSDFESSDNVTYFQFIAAQQVAMAYYAGKGVQNEYLERVMEWYKSGKYENA